MECRVPREWQKTSNQYYSPRVTYYGLTHHGSKPEIYYSWRNRPKAHNHMIGQGRADTCKNTSSNNEFYIQLTSERQLRNLWTHYSINHGHSFSSLKDLRSLPGIGRDNRQILKISVTMNITLWSHDYFELPIAVRVSAYFLIWNWRTLIWSRSNVNDWLTSHATTELLINISKFTTVNDSHEQADT